jgi:hypothetical protein
MVPNLRAAGALGEEMAGLDFLVVLRSDCGGEWPGVHLEWAKSWCCVAGLQPDQSDFE